MEIRHLLNFRKIMLKIYKIYSLLAVFLAAGLLGCEDEETIRRPDFYVPVILLAKTADGTNAKAEEADSLDITAGNDTYDFILAAEDFDGAADGHQYFTGRSGETSALVDGQLLIQYQPSGGSLGDPLTLLSFGPELNDAPVTVNISAQQLAGIFPEISSAADIAPGDAFEITYEYRIDANQTGTILNVGRPSSDYCGGFSFEGEFCELDIPIK